MDSSPERLARRDRIGRLNGEHRPGPTAVSAPVIEKKIASALPRSLTGKLATTIANAAGNRTAALAPCSTRKAIIQVSPIEPVGVAPHSAEKTAKLTTPIVTIRRGPNTPAILSPSANSADSADSASR